MYGNFLSYDSSYQYGLTQHTIPEIWRLLPEDYSPPFYAIALKLYCMVFGHSLVTMRTFSIFAVVGMLFIAAFPVNTLFGKRASFYCLIITFCSASLFNMLHEIRPTIFAMFFYMAVTVYAGLAYSTEKRYPYICLTVFSVLAMYTHNVAMVGTFGVYVVLLLFSLITRNWKKMRSFLICGGICGLLYIPWLKIVLSQITHVEEHYWESDFNLFDIWGWIFKDFYQSDIGYTTAVFWIEMIIRLLIGTIIFSIILKHIKFKELKTAKKIKDVINFPAEKSVYINISLIFLCLVSSIAVMELVAFFIRNIRAHRYYYILGIVWIVVLAALIGNLGNRYICLVFALILTGNNIINILSVKNDRDASNMSQIVSDVRQRSENEEIRFLHLHEYSLGIMSYYFPEATHYVCDETFTVLRDFDVFDTNVVDIGSIDNIWNYTDKCYVFTTKWVNSDDQYFIVDEMKEMNNNEIVEIDNYTMAYYIFSKSFNLAEAVYTGEKTEVT
ncbi:MAG: glycosyltransferase family 39 protein [Ruminococcaceae bacterium]|nr:glycosyltransferase family 39 protein [Oscillospiraceae bacterium]